jgi:hypothetical protein
MRIRTTERDHEFTQRLFEKLNLFSIQGLTLNANKEFSAAIEAIQYEANEEVNLETIFPIIEAKAKYYLAKILEIPFYYVIYQSAEFRVYEIELAKNFHSKQIEVFNEKGFVDWWAKLKGLNQPKPLMEAAERVKNSIFDITLEKHKMAWGGNIDGFMFRNKEFACIIENIYTQKNPLESLQGEPSYYFHMRGPNYNTWFPTVKLASFLNVPLFLFTIEGNNNKERIGFAVIDHLSTSGIFYKGNKPNKNILEGLENIMETINANLNSISPKLI